MFAFARFLFPASKPKGYWTKDGKKIPGSDFEGPEGANDVKLYWIAIQFTKDGKPQGPPHLPPDDANDVVVDLTGQGERKN